LLSLTRIFAGSKDDIVTGKISNVWETHENAAVREVAILSLAMIGNADRLRYIITLRDLLREESSEKVSASALWSFCPDVKIRPESKLDWALLKANMADKMSTMRHTMFSILRLCAAPPGSLEDRLNLTELFDTLKEHVICYPLSRPLVLQAAMLLVRTHGSAVEKLPQAERQDLLKCVADIWKTTVFTEVQQGALRVLQKFNDPRAKAIELLGSLKDATMTAMSAVMSEKVGHALSEASGKGKQEASVLADFYPDAEMDVSEYASDPDRLLRVSKKSSGGLLAPVTNTTTPGLVLLLFILIQSAEVPGELVNKLLASRHGMERICGLLHVRVTKRHSFRGQVFRLLVNDPLEDVRAWAASALTQLSTSKEVLSQGDRLLELEREVLTTERHNLVLDLEFITGVQDEAEVEIFFDTLR